MKKLWVTYSWEDNTNGDVEYIAQELEKVGISVKLDRWNIKAGKRLWEQIDNFITNPSESDALAIIATQNSLGSEPCKEEVSYALDRALITRGHSFPLIGIFTTDVDKELIPSSIKTRLFVSLKDTDWIERIKSTLEDRTPNIPRPIIEPYTVETRISNDGRIAIEMRPRAGAWSPFFCAIPLVEKEKIQPMILSGPKGSIPTVGVQMMAGEGESDDKKWWIMYSGNEATPTTSYYLFCKELPSQIVFGISGGKPQYLITMK